uniref:Uncharacterized protein n=1 Tax=Aegilops tauschii subsp. strangulata TaxID=200361 RepID=A0A453CMM9_AEGTS
MVPFNEGLARSSLYSLSLRIAALPTLISRKL